MDSSRFSYDWNATQLPHQLIVQPAVSSEYRDSQSVHSSSLTHVNDGLATPYRPEDSDTQKQTISQHSRGISDGGDRNGDDILHEGRQETWVDFLRHSSTRSQQSAAVQRPTSTSNGCANLVCPPLHTSDNSTVPQLTPETPLTSSSTRSTGIQRFTESGSTSGDIYSPDPWTNESTSTISTAPHPQRSADSITSGSPHTEQPSAVQECIKKRRLETCHTEGELPAGSDSKSGQSRAKMSRSEIVDRHSSPGPSRPVPHGVEPVDLTSASEDRGMSINTGPSGTILEEPWAGRGGQLFDNTFLPPRTPVMGMGRRPSDFALPRWQPDSEVIKCPVCGNHFGFFYRKHHCRKCGRVVCGTCSPHRITMPHQYIVEPPALIDLTSDEGDVSPHQPTHGNPTLEGGAQVRVCNPCVPDPNFSPPPQHAENLPPPYMEPSLIRSAQQSPQWANTATNGRSWGAFNSAPSTGQWLQHGLHQQAAAQRRGSTNRSSVPDPFRDGRVTFHNPSSTANLFPPPTEHNQRRPSILDAPLPPPPSFPRFDVEQLAAPRTSSRVHRPHHSTGNASGFLFPPVGSQSQPIRHSFLDQLPGPSTGTGSQRGQPQGLPDSLGPSGTFGRQPLPPPIPRRQIAEEDECPVCGHELPPKSSDGGELDRERHVEECIASHFTPSGPSRVTSTVPGDSAEGQSTDPTLPQNFPTGAPATSSQLPAADHIGRPVAGSPNSTSFHPTTPQPRQRRATGNRMLAYTATEKDCVAEEGELAAECIICFEEFEPGVELGRLECLCKFHRSCIRRWWEAKGMGTCPTHQLHD